MQNISNISVYGEPATLKGTLPQVGDPAPEVRVVDHDYRDVIIGGAKDKPQLILTVPTLDGEVCPKEIEHLDDMLKDYQHRIYTHVVSMDLPHAHRRYCIVFSISNLKTYSDFRYRELEKYGVLINSGVLQGLLARAAFLIDTTGKIAYVQLVHEQTDEPNYDEILSAIDKVLG